MAYGEKQIGFTVNDGVNVVTQEMEFNGKVLSVEVRISEKFGFVDMNIVDHATGDSIDLDVQLSKDEDKPLEATLTTGDEEIGTINKEQFEIC